MEASPHVLSMEVLSTGSRPSCGSELIFQPNQLPGLSSPRFATFARRPGMPPPFPRFGEAIRRRVPLQRQHAVACEPLRLVAPDVESEVSGGRSSVVRNSRRHVSTPASVTLGVSGWRLGRVLLDPTCTVRPSAGRSPSQRSPSRRGRDYEGGRLPSSASRSDEAEQRRRARSAGNAEGRRQGTRNRASNERPLNAD